MNEKAKQKAYRALLNSRVNGSESDVKVPVDWEILNGEDDTSVRDGIYVCNDPEGKKHIVVTQVFFPKIYVVGESVFFFLHAAIAYKDYLEFCERMDCRNNLFHSPNSYKIEEITFEQMWASDVYSKDGLILHHKSELTPADKKRICYNLKY